MNISYRFSKRDSKQIDASFVWIEETVSLEIDSGSFCCLSISGQKTVFRRQRPRLISSALNFTILAAIKNPPLDDLRHLETHCLLQKLCFNFYKWGNQTTIHPNALCQYKVLLLATKRLFTFLNKKSKDIFIAPCNLQGNETFQFCHFLSDIEVFVTFETINDSHFTLYFQVECDLFFSLSNVSS